MTTDTDPETGRADRPARPAHDAPAGGHGASAGGHGASAGGHGASAPADDALLGGDWLADDDAPLPPPRPRKRLTPLTGGLLAVLLVAGGFLGGVLVQKHQGGDGGGAGGFPAGFPGAAAMAGGAAGGGAAAGGMPGAAGGGATAADRGSADANGGAPGAIGGATGAGATVGEVVTVKGDTLYVREASGNTVKVRAQKGATVTRTVDSEPSEIRPGEQVVVQVASRDGTVRATSITAGDATAGLSALMAGGFGGGPAGGDRSASGDDAVDSLFNDSNGAR